MSKDDDEEIAEALARAVYFAETIIHHDHEAHWRDAKRLNRNLWKDVGNAVLAEARRVAIIPAVCTHVNGREAVAQWMIAHGYATGHGDTTADLLGELVPQIREAVLREAGAIARSWMAGPGNRPDDPPPEAEVINATCHHIEREILALKLAGES